MARRPQLFRRELPVGFFYPDSPRAGVHRGRHQNRIVPDDARLQGAVTLELPLIVEALLAIGWIDAEQTIIRQQEHQFLAGDRIQLRRTVGIIASRGRPAESSRPDIKGEQAFVTRTSSVNDGDGAGDERRRRETPYRHGASGHRFQILLPENCAGGGIQPQEHSGGARYKQSAIRNGRRGPRSRTPKRIVQPRFDLPLPHFAAGVRVIANHRFHRTALLLREKEVPRDREGRPRWANWDFPQLSRG